MGRQRLRTGDVVARSGVSRKALRLYEIHGILPKPERTEAGYRLYGDDVLPLLRFVTLAQRLGFSLREITEIVAIRRAGQMPCPHVRARLQQREADLTETLTAVRAVLRAWRRRHSAAVVCPHLEAEPR